MSRGDEAESDPYLNRLRGARKSAAVLKAKLISLRSTIPDVAIFVLEGADDKVVFHHWFQRIRPELKYEPFPCDGKKAVRELKGALNRDLGSLREGIYFFVDRDFDDLRGFSDVENTFVTDRHSVESYMVCEEVLETILANEFPLHGEPALRAEIVSTFSSLIESFLNQTKEINQRLFVAARLDLGLVKVLPDKFSALGEIFPDKVIIKADPEDIVVFSRAVNPDELAALQEEFATLDGRKRYRGKFALTFFERWLAILVNEWNSESRQIFGDCDRKAKPRPSEFRLGGFAAKSPLPIGLGEFLAQIPA